ncbi:uncharacterized protein LOC141677551 [Apium graveolens]|uniref:uncharacterized protein LOC141677551 n=1 Tax=Apium graveolens TaxID=4045 RepID=UPI003D7AA940
MGFDNECIVNIQSLAGEYFCPVCRTLVYPNEALQSQCTHLYCKLCLTYVVRTTKACPYDGYLVTEKDSKPLVESDKALADRIGNTLVHCLFYKSGCLWLGPLSECNSHCSGCSFGNFPVMCNVCGVQIIHRQVQEHAQSCPGEYYLHQQYYLPAQLVQLQSTYGGQPQAYAQHQMQGQYQSLSQVQGQGQTQTKPQPQGHSHAQSFVQSQVDAQQQSHLVTQPCPHIQVNAQTAAQGHITQHQPNPKKQPPPLPNSAKPPAQQNLQAPSQGHQAQLQTKVQHQSNPQSILQSHPQSHPYLHPLQPNNHPSQQPAPSVVPGNQPHPPVQSHQQTLQPPQQQNPIPIHPSGSSFPPSAQFRQQSPHVRSSQTNALPPNQQQANHMLSQSQIQGVPTAQHTQTSQQGCIGHQPPALIPLQEPSLQYRLQPFSSLASGSVQGPSHQIPFGQQPMQTQSQPQGPTLSQQNVVARPPPPMQGSVQAHDMPPQYPQAYRGRPVESNQTVASHPFPQPGGVFGGAADSRPLPSSLVQPSGHQTFEGGIGKPQVPSVQKFSHSDRSITLTLGEGSDAAQCGPALNKTVDVSGPGEDSVRVRVLEAEIRGKIGDEKYKITSAGENNATYEGTRNKAVEAEVDALKAGMKKIVTEKDGIFNLDSLSGGNKSETAILDEKDSSVFVAKQTENSRAKNSTVRQTEAYAGHNTHVLAQEHKLSNKQVTAQGHAVREYARTQDKGLINSSIPATLTDQGRYQMPSGPYGPSSHQQRPAMPSNSQSGSYLGAPPNALPGQGPSHLKPKGPGLSAPLHQSRYPSEYYQGVQRGQVNQNNPPSQPTFSNTLKAEPIGPLHGFDGVALLQNQRLHHSKDGYLDPYLSESFDQSLYKHCVPAFEAASGPHLKNVDDHKNQFMIGSGRIGQGEYEQAPKQFPKLLPTHIGNGSLSAGDYPHKCNYDNPSKFLPPYHPSWTFNANNVGERPTGTQPDFPGSGPECVVDHLPPRCPGREYYGIPSRGFAGLPDGPYNQPGHVDVHARGTYAVQEGSRTFDMSSDPTGKPLRDYLRSGDMTGQDFIPNHLRRVEFFGPRNVPSHFHAVDGFGTFPDPRMGEFTGRSGLPNTESFVGNKSNHLRLGEPGFRSSFSLHGFSSSGGFYAGNLDSFDRLRKRMPTSMGWCRICKVDCGSVDGLDLHSQTTEHQRRTMDMVISIKQQSAKRQKTSKDHSSVEERIRSRCW